MVDGSLTGTDDLCNFSFTASGIWRHLPGILMQVTVIQGGGGECMRIHAGAALLV